MEQGTGAALADGWSSFSVDNVANPALFYTHAADHLWSRDEPPPTAEFITNALNSLHTRLHYAVEIEDVEMVKHTLQTEPDLLKFSFKWRGTPLHVAAVKGNVEIMRLLLNAAEANEPSALRQQLTSPASFGRTPIMIAAANGKSECLRLLLEEAKKAKCENALKLTDDLGMSPLHAAASTGSVECVTVLLEYGDDVNERHDDMSALHLAAFYGHVDMLKLLISKGCQVSWCSRRSGETPLHRAAVRGHTECVRVLLDSGAVIDAKDSMGNTPLHQASFFGRIDCAGLLVEAGADVNAKNSIGAIPFSRTNEDLKLMWRTPRITGLHPGPRHGHSATKVGAKLFIIGGSSEKEERVDVVVLDTDAMMWYRPTVKGDAPASRSFHSATLVGSKLYVFGGSNDSHYFNDLFIFDALTMQWSAVEAKGDIPEPLSGHSATLFGSQIFVFGGYDGQTYHDQLYVFDTQTLEWRKQNPSGDIPPARAWHTGNQVRTKIFIFGGTGASAYNDLHILDPGVMRFYKQSVVGQPRACSGHASALVGNKLFYLAGGMFDSGLDDLNILDTENFTWSAVKLKIGGQRSKWTMANFSGHNLTLVGSSLYCYGGYFFEKYNTTVRVMETGTRTTLESDMKNAFITNDFADVTFRFPNEDNALIKAHKIVLASRSQKFRDLLQGRDEEGLTIDINDIPRELFQVLMELCYTDHLTSCPHRAQQLLSLVKAYIPQSYKRTLACLIQKGKVASSLGDDLRQNALGSPLFSDVIFEVEGRDVPCHKVVITSRCPQFQAMFLSGMRESTAEKIPLDLHYPIFLMFLEFLYTDDVDFTKVSPDDVIELLGVANQYTLDQLTDRCDRELQKFIDFENVVVLFQAASLYHAERLRSSCVKFILRSYDKLEKEGVLEQLSEDVVEELNLLKENMDTDKYSSSLQGPVLPRAV